MNVKKYFEPEVVGIQVSLPKDLVAKVLPLAAKDNCTRKTGVNWQKLVRALLTAYVEEHELKRKGERHVKQ